MTLPLSSGMLMVIGLCWRLPVGRPDAESRGAVSSARLSPFTSPAATVTPPGAGAFSPILLPFKVMSPPAAGAPPAVSVPMLTLPAPIPPPLCVLLVWVAPQDQDRISI